jgi:hypothetical protein
MRIVGDGQSAGMLSTINPLPKPALAFPRTRLVVFKLFFELNPMSRRTTFQETRSVA